MSNSDVLRELHAAWKKRQDDGDRRPGEFTTAEYAEANGLKPGTARRVLREQRALGHVTARPAEHKGNALYYRDARKKEEE